MHFKVSDVVVHPAYGIGHIVKIMEKQFSKKNAARLYYQITMPNRNTMWTPVEDQVSNGLRLVTAKSELERTQSSNERANALLFLSTRQAELEPSPTSTH